MSEPFLGEIRLASFSIAPRGWALCNGQVLPISQNQALFSLLGTQYGGDGRTTFALPDLRGRVPVHAGDGVRTGQRGGSEAVTLTTAQIPAHTHDLAVSSQRASLDDPAGAYWAADGSQSRYAAAADSAMAGGLVGTAGGSQAHENRQPSLVVNFIIALQGIFPPRN